MSVKLSDTIRRKNKREKIRDITPSPSLAGRIPTLIKPENRSAFYIFPFPHEVEKKKKEALKRYSVKIKDYLKVSG